MTGGQHVDGELTRGWAVWTEPYEGPANTLHGGFVAAAFDDLMGFAQVASGTAGYTGTLAASSEIDELAWFRYADRPQVPPVDQLLFDDLHAAGQLR